MLRGEVDCLVSRKNSWDCDKKIVLSLARSRVVNLVV